jgi:hypothetical protein
MPGLPSRGVGSERPRNIVLDAKTVGAMVRIYCRDVHRPPSDALCGDCAALLAYADVRLGRCPFGPEKTTCRECPIHCYRPAQRSAMKAVMRHAGPRMLWRHPWLALRHLWLDRQGAPPWPPQASRRPEFFPGAGEYSRGDRRSRASPGEIDTGCPDRAGQRNCTGTGGHDVDRHTSQAP